MIFARYTEIQNGCHKGEFWNSLPKDLQANSFVRQLHVFFYYYLKFKDSFNNCDNVC